MSRNKVFEFLESYDAYAKATHEKREVLKTWMLSKIPNTMIIFRMESRYYFI